MLVELVLSTRICLVLNPSIISMITSGSSCGCFTFLEDFFASATTNSLDFKLALNVVSCTLSNCGC